MRLAIHQPNFFPWAGLFHKIASVDRFMFFDHIQAPNGKSWLSRNRILIDGEVRWLTIPIRRSSGQRISEVAINYSENFQRKHLGTLRQAYGKSPHFAEVFEFLESLYGKKIEKLSQFNEEFIQWVCARTGIGTSFCRSSELVAEFPEIVDYAGNDLVLHLSMKAAASGYLSGSGCTDFIQSESFSKNGIGFEFQRFDHPVYPQGAGNVPFVPSLSVVDALFRVGFGGVTAWWRSTPL